VTVIKLPWDWTRKNSRVAKPAASSWNGAWGAGVPSRLQQTWYQRSTNSPELACVSWKAGKRTLVCCSENILLMHHWPCGTHCSYISFQLWVARSTSQSLRFFCCWMGAGFFLSCISWEKWSFLWLSGLRMRNFTWNRFPIKICWSIPCLHPSRKVHTWVIGFKTNRGEDKQISFTKKLRGASKHQTSRAKCQHHRSHDTPADVSNLRSWRTRNISKGFVSWEMLLSTHAWNWYETCLEPMDDFTNKLLFDQSKISLTTKIRFKLVLKMSFVKLRSRFGTLMD